MTTPKSPSPSRRYVAMCNKGDFTGFYFRSFSLPVWQENTRDCAAWYFLNRLNFSACLETLLTEEEYQNIQSQKEPVPVEFDDTQPLKP